MDDRNSIKATQPSSTGSTSATLEETYNGKAHKAWDQNSERMFEQDLSWEDVKWLKQSIRVFCYNNNISTPIPLIIKGIMTGEDAELAISIGNVDGIMVSNHGGRQLDSCLASIDVLPEVVKVVHHRVPVLLDGGIRRGNDVVKALALGATAVGIGKPMFFALAVHGEDGVTSVLDMLQRETEAAMALCGCASVTDITVQHITRHPRNGGGAPYIRSAL